jgi:hypothetical protein
MLAQDVADLEHKFMRHDVGSKIREDYRLSLIVSTTILITGSLASKLYTCMLPAGS